MNLLHIAFSVSEETNRKKDGKKEIDLYKYTDL